MAERRLSNRTQFLTVLAIPPSDEDPKRPLATYFARSVIGGCQAFVMSPTGPRDYTAALRRKLVIDVSMNVTYKQGITRDRNTGG